MAEYGIVEGCDRDGYWRIIAVDDETVHMEENENRNDDQSKLEPGWQNEEDEIEDSRHTTTTKVQSIQRSRN